MWNHKQWGCRDNVNTMQEKSVAVLEPCLATEAPTGKVCRSSVSEKSWQKLNLCYGFVMKTPGAHSVCPLAENPLRSHTWTQWYAMMIGPEPLLVASGHERQRKSSGDIFAKPFLFSGHQKQHCLVTPLKVSFRHTVPFIVHMRCLTKKPSPCVFFF